MIHALLAAQDEIGRFFFRHGGECVRDDERVRIHERRILEHDGTIGAQR